MVAFMNKIIYFYFHIFILLCSVSCVSISSTKNTKTSQKKQNPYSSFNKGLQFFKKGDLDTARMYFERVDKTQRYFVPSLLEIQKINYLQKKWDQFFGLAWYYREVLLSSAKISPQNFKQELLALEVLALIQHCYFEESNKIIKWGIQKARSLNRSSLKIRQAGFFSRKFFNKNPELKEVHNSWREHVFFWPLELYQLPWIDNPKKLRIKINDRC